MNPSYDIFSEQTSQSPYDVSSGRNDSPPGVQPLYLQHTASSQLKREQPAQIQLSKAFETLRHEQIKGSLIQQSNVSSVGERMVESCNADPQLNQFVRKNLRLIQYKDEGGVR